MSWSFTATAKDKTKLKVFSRQTLVSYAKEGSVHHVGMSKVADQIDGLLDMFDQKPGQLIKLETSGHLEGGAGSLKVDITNFCGTFLE